jgi:hypothetical protein
MTEATFLHGCNGGGARFGLRLRGDRVLKVEYHDVARESARLRNCLGVRGRKIKRAATRAICG